MTEKKLLNSFGRRIGKRLGQTSRDAIENTLPEHKVDYEELAHTTLPITLEIGFGTGDFLLEYASLYQNKLCIGCEPFLNGVASLLKRVTTKNIRIWPDDARLLLAELPDELIQEVFILFPDPWPKRKQHQRRLISPEFLATIAPKLKPGAELNIATDHADYANWILNALQESKDFIWRDGTKGHTNNEFEFVNLTRYYKKTITPETQPHFFRLIKV